MNLILCEKEKIIARHEQQGFPKVRKWKRLICWFFRHHAYLFQNDQYYNKRSNVTVFVAEGLCLRCGKYFQEVACVEDSEEYASKF